MLRCVYTAARPASLLPRWSFFASGMPTSIQAVIRPVRSRTRTAGSSPADTPSVSAMPSVYSRQYARKRVSMNSSVSDGCRASRRLNVSYTPRSTSESSVSKL